MARYEHCAGLCMGFRFYRSNFVNGRKINYSISFVVHAASIGFGIFVIIQKNDGSLGCRFISWTLQQSAIVPACVILSERQNPPQ